LLELYPDNQWTWFELSKNPAISCDFIRNNNLPWIIEGLARHPHIELDIIFNHPKVSKRCWAASFSKRLTEEIIRADHDGAWYWTMILYNENISTEFIVNHPNFDNWNNLSSSYRLTIELIDKYRDKPWNWWLISGNSRISIDTILSRTNIPWDWSGVSANHNLTIDVILDNPDVDWDWYRLSINHRISIQDALDNSNLPWDWNRMINKIKDVEIIFDNLDKFCSAVGISQNRNITWNIIDAHPKIKWSWHHLLRFLQVAGYEQRILDIISAKYLSFNQIRFNKNLTEEFILSNLDKDWNWQFTHWRFDLPILPINETTKDYMSAHPRLSWEMVVDNIDMINWKELSRNLFGRK